jgi:hypothetical protein
MTIIKYLYKRFFIVVTGHGAPPPDNAIPLIQIWGLGGGVLLTPWQYGILLC